MPDSYGDQQRAPKSGRTDALVAHARNQVDRLEGALDAAGDRVLACSSPDSAMLQINGSVARFPGFKLVREIREGGQGVVFEAIQQSTGKRVAIKVVRDSVFAGRESRARLELGMRILGQLKHPNIVDIIDSGVVGGCFYYVMEYVDGVPLNTFIDSLRRAPISGKASTFIADSRNEQTRTVAKRAFEKSQAIKPTGEDISCNRVAPPGPSYASRNDTKHANHRSAPSSEYLQTSLRLFAKICDAVHAAHLKGVIHRDLKPANIRIDAEGEPHVLDFDLAKLLAGDLRSRLHPAEITQQGQFIGTLPYASPEQVSYDPDRIDVRTDVYSLGVILYQILTDRFPYVVVGAARDVADNILRTPPARPRSIVRRINGDLETIVLKCLAKDPQRRYQSAGALADDVRRYLNGDAIEARRDSTLYVLYKLALRHAYATGTIVALIGCFVGFAGASYTWYLEAEEAKARTEQMVIHLTNVQTKLADQLRDRVRNQALGWFLSEWEMGRTARAQEILAAMPPDARETAVMRYLVLKDVDNNALTERAGEALASFAIAERDRSEGRLSEALAQYSACLAAGRDGHGGDWLARAAQARIDQLNDRLPDSDSDFRNKRDFGVTPQAGPIESEDSAAMKPATGDGD